MTRQGTRRLDSRCSEQGKLPAARAFKLAERDNRMSEEKKTSFMEELDKWTEASVVAPLADPANENNFDAAVEQVKKAVRQKVLESYRNGQAGGSEHKPRRAGFVPRRQFSK